jgi:serine protease inhibitor
MAMLMLATGLGAPAAAEVRRALRQNDTTLSMSLVASRELASVLTGGIVFSTSSTHATIANSVWVERRFELAPDFVRVLATQFDAAARPQRSLTRSTCCQ